jgi:hypothetical protein
VAEEKKGNPGSETIESVSTSAEGQQQQVQLEVDDNNATTLYSTTFRVWGSAEEINLDFAGPVRPAGQGKVKLRIDQRVVLNPYAAKRLALQLGQAVAQYEQAYGTLELDPRKRMKNPPQ